MAQELEYTPDINLIHTPLARPNWHQTFMEHARTAAKRATCLRAKVGAIIVRDNHVIASGYNGSVAGLPHCFDVGCDLVDGHCQRCCHAEMNAIAQAAKLGHAVEGSTIYTTVSPCWVCVKVLLNAGVREFIFEEPYRLTDLGERVRACGTAPRGLVFVLRLLRLLPDGGLVNQQMRGEVP